MRYGKGVFITGGSSGIGLATAECLAKQGYTVFAGSRTAKDNAEKYTGGGVIYPVKIDVNDPESVHVAAKHVLARSEIGTIIHCAGIGVAASGTESPECAGIELFETNFFGVLRVNNAFLPAMELRGSGLCIIVGSVAGVFAIPYQSHYSACKAALDIYVRALRLELRHHGINVSLVMPGDTSTGFTGSRVIKTSEDSPYYKECLAATKRMEHDEINGRPPQSAAKVISRLMHRKSPPIHKVVGLDYKLMVFLRRVFPGCLIERILARMYLK